MMKKHCLHIKYVRTLAAFFSLSLLFAGCGSDDDEKRSVNTTDTMVGFEKASYAVKETETYLNVPISVSEEVARNGDVVLKVRVTGHNFAEGENIGNVILTTEHLRIPFEKKSTNAELSLRVENKEVQTGRYITLEIVDVDGASIGQNAKCTISIQEKNYIEGTYEIRGVNPYTGYILTEQVAIYAEDETMDKVFLDFNVGGGAKMTFTELLPEELYNFVIEPFTTVGQYNGKDVYLTWADLKYNDKEVFLKPEYNREKPVTGHYEILKGENGDKVHKFTFTCAIGVLSLNEKDEPDPWYQNYVYTVKTTMTKKAD